MAAAPRPPPTNIIINEMINIMMKMKNNILAMPAAAEDIPVKPNKPATKAITKKSIVKYNTCLSSFNGLLTIICYFF